MDDQKLREYFKFDEADLQANRNGAFSEGQKQRLFSMQTGAIHEKRVAVLVALPLSLLMLTGMGYLIYRDYTGGSSSDVPYAFFLGLCGLPLLAAAIYIFKISFIRQNYLLKKVQGPINIIKQSRLIDNHTYTDYELHVGGKKFDVDAGLGDLLMQGDLYAFYYWEGSVNSVDRILSAESIAKAG